jgi:putative flippase GtrA
MTLTISVVKDICRRNYRNFFKYVFVGGSTFVLDLGLLVFLHAVCQVPVILAATVSYWTSIAYNFAMNRQWTFDTTASLRHHAVAYGILLLTNYVVTIGIIAALGAIHVNYAMAKVLAVVVSMSWTYVIYKKVIFV